MAELKDDKLYEEVRYELKDLNKCFLVGAYTNTKERELCLEHLKELERLANTYGFEVVGVEAVHLRKIDARTYLGKGKVEEIGETIHRCHADVAIFDNEMTPNQERNLEKAFKLPVLDRTELILEIFSQRAKTKEARLQIELAKSRYQLPRLKRLWTHLSRQSSGGGGFLKGAGEKQIEIDRRLVQTRIAKLQKELVEVQNQRRTQRQKRLRSNIPSFAIIGYTNAGKSTLLRELTQADVFVEDKLFATLDTTTRKFFLPNQMQILLIDTVGFIRKIPHGLVAAFKSTLEEALYTDILLHLIDASHKAAEEQAEATFEVLNELGGTERPIITVLNKIDQVDDRKQLMRFRVKYPKTVMISAQTHEGFDQLQELMVEELQKLRIRLKLIIPQSHYALISEVMRLGHVHHTDYQGNDVHLEAEVPTSLKPKLMPFICHD